MNIITVTGNLGKDAEVVDGPKGRFMTFSLANGAKDKDGNEVTTWYSVRTYYSETMEGMLKKGARALVVGDLQVKEVNGKCFFNVFSYKIEMLGGHKEEGGYQYKEQLPTSAMPKISAPAPKKPDVDDGLPF